MLTIIKRILVAIAIISGIILGVLFLQDRTKKIEDRNYKEINKVIIDADTSDINIYKSKDESVRVVAYGTAKDEVQIIEGSKYLTITKKTSKKTCFLNCKNEIDVYVPEDFDRLEIKVEEGNINVDKVTVKNIVANTELGNISIYKTENVDLTSNTGNIYINIIKATNNSSIKTEVGNINITNTSNLKLEAKSETGSVVIPVIKEDQDFTLKIESKVGNIDIIHHENKSK